MNVRSKRRWLWLLGFGCLCLPVLDNPPLQTGAYVQNVTETGAVIAKVTATATILQVSVEDVTGANVRTLEDRLPARRHVFAVDGLQAGHSYRYQVIGSGRRVVDEGRFWTPPGNDRSAVEFTIVGDSGRMPHWVWLQRAPLFHLPARWEWLPPHSTVALVGEQMAAAAPKFVLHVGDVVYPWGQQGHYAAGFFRPFADLLRNAPCYAVLGNHDVMDDDGRQALGNFVLPRGEEGMEERCYSFAWGSVRVIVVDTNGRLGPGHPTLDFARRELLACGEPWIVVTSHYPILSASRQGDRADLIEHLLPLLREHEVDLYVCGHDHTYQRYGEGREPGDVVMVVSGGGGKSLYDLRPDPRASVLQAQYQWCQVRVEGTRLELRSHGINGSLIDSVRLEKRLADPDLERVAKRNPHRSARLRALRGS